MRLSEIISEISPTLYPLIAFVLFLGAGVAIAYYAFTRRNRETFDRARSLPLEDDDHEARGVSQ